MLILGGDMHSHERLLVVIILADCSRNFHSTLFAFVKQRIQSFTGRQHTACYASPVLAVVGMSVCLSVRLSVRCTLALSENDAS